MDDLTTPEGRAALRELVSEARAWAGEMKRSAENLRDLGPDCDEIARGNRKVAGTLERLADVVEAHVIDPPEPAPGDAGGTQGAEE